MTKASKYLRYIIMFANRLMKNTIRIEKLRDKDGIERKDITKMFNITECNDHYSCYNCEFDGKHNFDGWCTCELLIFINKAILNMWRNDNEN